MLIHKQQAKKGNAGKLQVFWHTFPTRSHLFILPKQFYRLEPNTQTDEHMRHSHWNHQILLVFSASCLRVKMSAITLTPASMLVSCCHILPPWLTLILLEPRAKISFITYVVLFKVFITPRESLQYRSSYQSVWLLWKTWQCCFSGNTGDSGFWPRKAVECFRQSFIRCSSKRLENWNAERNEDSGRLHQEVSKEY